MVKQLRPALVLFLVMLLLTGILYPMTVTGLAQTIFPAQANGSIINRNGTLIGSTLIGQDFTDPKYFWGRPSATSGSPYTVLDIVTQTGSSGSNLGPLSQTLVDTIRTRTESLRLADSGNALPIPVDLVTASGSGLDPNISVAAAMYQVPRVAKARAMREADVRTLVDQYITGRQFGFLGEPRINVLLLNLALDGIK